MTDRTKPPSVEDQLKELKAGMAKLQEANENLQRTNFQLMSLRPEPGSGGTTPRPDIQSLELNTKDLPDPVTNPTGYAQELAKRAQQLVKAQQEDFNQRLQQQQTTRTKSDGLWANFQTQYPHLKGKDDQLSFAVSRVVARAEALGVDRERYMYGPGQQQFFKEVSEEHEKIFGKQEVGKTPSPSASTKAEGDEPNRTSILAGSDGSVRTAPDAGDPNDKPGDMTKELLTAQKELGYF